MPSFFKKEKLLRDVMREGDYEEFRRKVFEQTRREVRRRCGRRVFPWVAAAAMLVLGVFLGQTVFGRGKAPAPQGAKGDESQAVEVANRVANPPPAQVEIVETVPFPDRGVVRSVARQSLIVTTDARGLPSRMLVTSSSTSPEAVDDSQLLALFPNRPAGFMTAQSGERFFVMGNMRSTKREPEPTQ